MDPNLLIGLVNTGLRNESEESDLSGFCKKHDLDQDVLKKRLSEIGYVYVPELKQFRAEGAVENK